MNSNSSLVKPIFILSLIVFGLADAGFAQTTYLPLHTEEYHLLDRLEAKTGELSPFFFELKPIARKDAISFLKEQSQNVYLSRINLTRIDNHNIQRALSVSGEWSETADGMDGSEPSRKPILRYFYQYRPDLVHVHTDDFFLVVNPVIYAEYIQERGVGHWDYINTRGAELRGRILNKVGFYTMLADNQEKVVSYVGDWSEANEAFPGMDYYRNKGKMQNYDLFLARGYVDAGLLRDHVNITFGYDKNFQGDGIRSLFLSDFGAPATFLRLRSRLGRFSYQNLFLELTSDYEHSGDQQLKHKYAAIHQLGFRAARWLNIGIFESTLFAKENHFNAGYLIPVIGYHSLAHALGDDNKTSLGLNFKALVLHTLQFYGQAYFDQLKFNELGNNGWWGNQFGIQLGGKYFDAFTLSNLDLQGEMNWVRPFTYASADQVTDYTHYNQPLAHPYGAGFAEWIGTARYQPLPDLYLSAKFIYALRGTDSSENLNYGNDIFKSYDSRIGDYGYNLAAGSQMKGIYLNFNAAYELRPNIFLEAGATYLRRELDSGIRLPSSTSFYGGLRWNIARKEYDNY